MVDEKEGGKWWEDRGEIEEGGKRGTVGGRETRGTLGVGFCGLDGRCRDHTQIHVWRVHTREKGGREAGLLEEAVSNRRWRRWGKDNENRGRNKKKRRTKQGK